MIRILVADDHVLFRDGIRRIIDGQPMMQIVAEVSDGRELLAAARQNGPDVVLLDVNMPGRGGLEGIEDLKRWNASVAVLMVTARPEDEFAIRCLRSGADGYLTKTSAASELVSAIRRVHQGGKYVSPKLGEALILAVTGGGEQRPHESLSDRELQVLELMGSGMTVSEIGAELCLSVKTISTYRTRLLEKLNLRNTAELIRYAILEGLVD